MEVAIISGKGGTGKSSITSGFITLAKSVMSVDCDVDASNLYLLLNPTKEGEENFITGHHAVIDYEKCNGCQRCIPYCKFEAISYKENKTIIDEIACEGCFLCTRICPEQAITMVPSDKSKLFWGDVRYGKMVYGHLAPGEENSGKLINKLRTKAKEIAKLNSYDTIILDGPPGTSCPVISTITGVDKVVIVTEPTISGISDLKRTIAMVNNFKVEVYVIINKCDLNMAMSRQIEGWCKENSIPIIGKFPFDRSMVDAMIAGKSIIEYAPDSAISGLINSAFKKIF